MQNKITIVNRETEKKFIRLRYDVFKTLLHHHSWHFNTDFCIIMGHVPLEKMGKRRPRVPPHFTPAVLVRTSILRKLTYAVNMGERLLYSGITTRQLLVSGAPAPTTRHLYCFLSNSLNTSFKSSLLRISDIFFQSIEGVGKYAELSDGLD